MNTKRANTILKFSWLMIPAVLFLSMAGHIFDNNGRNNLYAFQAQAFLNGTLNIEEELNDLPGEVALSDGKFYNIFPPFPSLLLLPFVAVSGVGRVKVLLIAFMLCLLSCHLLYRILSRLNIDSLVIFWSLTAFMLGTAYWYTLRRSDYVWMFAQIVSVCCILLSIHEAQGRGRGALAGLFLGLAFLSRQLSIYSSIFILALLWQNPQKRKGAAFAFAALFGACILSYLIFVHAQFGRFESGYSEMIMRAVPINEFGGALFQKYGLFNIIYLPFNAIYMFVQGFHMNFNDAKQLTGLDPYGASLVAASPFLFMAFFAKMQRAALWAAWLSITLTLIHMLLYFNNGFIQFNAQRFTLDFMPILIILTALGLNNASADLTKLIKAAIIYAIVLNTITLFLVG